MTSAFFAPLPEMLAQFRYRCRSRPEKLSGACRRLGEGVRFVRFRGAASVELAAVWLEHPGNTAVATFVRTVTGP